VRNNALEFKKKQGVSADNILFTKYTSHCWLNQPFIVYLLCHE